MAYSGYLSLDAVPAKPDWKTLVKSSISFMKQIERVAALQERIADAERIAADV